MIQEQYQEAIKFVGEKHKDQLVPGTNSNYLLHLSNVSMEIMIAFQNEPNFELASAVKLALLHDVIEDTDATVEELGVKFGNKIADGVSALTKNEKLETKELMMDDSLNRIVSSFMEVSLVKIADRITNLQEPPSYWSREKIERYWHEAQKIYDKLSGKNKYLDERLANKIIKYKKYWLQSG